MNILAALDLSEAAKNVLATAVATAKEKGAQLTLFSVAEDFKDIGDFMDSASVSEKFLAAARKAQEEALKAAKDQGVDAKAVTEQGVSPADIIVRYAADNAMDLIIMGSKSKSALDRFLIGSVTSKVVAHAPCSVLVLR
ncbi:universal stress protein [Fundidesulfovibrio terrae]|uniref:universal stress protein n=1 Tax=Fundidesulfovibrio terrae TaxID=2922866 RepID=UPI001FAF1D0C|nr:universal stress protein [Fundidesulfovibrio terrae]